MKVLPKNFPRPAVAVEKKEPQIRVVEFKSIRGGTLFVPFLYEIVYTDKRSKQEGHHFATQPPAAQYVREMAKKGVIVRYQRRATRQFIKCNDAPGVARSSDGEAARVMFHPLQKCTIAFY